MIVTTAIIAIASLQAKPVQLSRVFVKGEKAQYQVHSTLNAEQRQIGLDTWIPSDLDLIYKFNYEVTAMKADGICVMRYLRPTMTEVEGETVDSQPKTKTTKVNYDLTLTVSPINEILDIHDNAKKKDPPKKPLLALAPNGLSTSQNPLENFTGEIYRLALFIGGLDSSMDFSPPLPFDEVSVGDKWKKTVGFSPQKLQGKGDKLAVQRLDFEYTYKGPVTVNGKPYLRIEAALATKVDLAEYLHQVFKVKSDVTGLKEVPMNLTTKVEYDLDPKTHRTVRAEGKSEGGFRIISTSFNEAVQEERFKARTTLTRLSTTN